MKRIVAAVLVGGAGLLLAGCAGAGSGSGSSSDALADARFTTDGVTADGCTRMTGYGVHELITEKYEPEGIWYAARDASGDGVVIGGKVAGLDGLALYSDGDPAVVGLSAASLTDTADTASEVDLRPPSAGGMDHRSGMRQNSLRTKYSQAMADRVYAKGIAAVQLCMANDTQTVMDDGIGLHR